MVNAAPLVSVVIPTHTHAQYLPRAIRSALECQGGSVEVIVVPNGPGSDWRDALRPWDTDQRVRISPLEESGVSRARNHGMRLARGKYLRFLDDDDYLLAAATAQLALLERSGVDVCSGIVLNIDEDGIDAGANSVPASDDFVCAATTLSGFCLPHGNLWRREVIQDRTWDASIREREDFAWMLDLAAAREWQWVTIHEPVGVWFQHRGPRGSSVRRPTGRYRGVISHLLGLHRQLANANRLTAERASAIASALWHYVHVGFPSHPIYWSRIAAQALAIDPASRPVDRFYTNGPFRSVDPVVGEWILLPVRRVTRIMRDTPQWWRGRDYRRKV